jgi:hypothetical protein
MTTIDKWWQELTPMIVAGVSHTTWPNAYKLPVTSANLTN